MIRFNFEGLPDVLTDHPHWLVCNESGKPISVGDAGNSKTNPGHWVSYGEALELCDCPVPRWPYLVLTKDSEITVFDIDFKPRKENETEADFAKRMIRADKALERIREYFPERYEELSKSGKGHHIIVSGSFEGSGGKGKGEWSDVEVYANKHGIAITGKIIDGNDYPYFQEVGTIQAIRDKIKGKSPKETSWKQTSTCSKVSLLHAKKVLNEIRGILDRPDRDSWLKITSATCSAFEKDQAIELLEEFFPHEEDGEYEKLIDSLGEFIPWETLRDFDVDPVDHTVDMPSYSESTEVSAKTASSFPKIIRASELLASDLQPPREIIRGVLGVGEKLMLAACSKGRKTTALMALAEAVQNGDSWLGFDCVKGNVLFINFEFKPERLKQRLEHFGAMEGIDLLTLKGIKVGWAELIKGLEANSNGYDLIILDPIYKMLHGSNENDNSEMADLLHEIERIASKMNTAIAFSHHFSKGSKSNTNQLDRASGAGVFARDPDAILTLMEHSDDGCLVLESTLRHYAPAEAKVFRIQHPYLVEDLMADATQIKGSSRAKKVTVDQVVGVASEEQCLKSVFLEKVVVRFSCSDKTARRRLSDAMEAGLLIIGKDGFVRLDS